MFNCYRLMAEHEQYRLCGLHRLVLRREELREVRQPLPLVVSLGTSSVSWIK